LPYRHPAERCPSRPIQTLLLGCHSARYRATIDETDGRHDMQDESDAVQRAILESLATPWRTSDRWKFSALSIPNWSAWRSFCS